jgi:hypothetical protein
LEFGAQWRRIDLERGKFMIEKIDDCRQAGPVHGMHKITFLEFALPNTKTAPIDRFQHLEPQVNTLIIKPLTLLSLRANETRPFHVWNILLDGSPSREHRL